MTVDAVLAELRTHRLVAVLRGSSAGHVVDVARGLIRCGVRILEVTYTIPAPAAAIVQLRQEFDRRITIAAGTITSRWQVDDALSAGADFLVSPGSSVPLLTTADNAGALLIPGVLTPTEILTAVGCGARIVKLFPSQLHGPPYLQAMRAVFPTLEFLPTGGVDATNIRRWLNAGAIAVGVGGPLASADDPPVADNDWCNGVRDHLKALIEPTETEATS